MGYIISVANNKGGCGKTTTACNLADALGKRGRSVLVVDMDSQSNATGKLLPRGTAIRKSVYDLLDPNGDAPDMSALFYPTECKGVSLLPNVSDTGTLEPEMILQKSFFRVREALRPHVVQHYDITIIDNPPNMGTFVLCSLYASDFVIVPVKAGSTDSVEGLIKATRLIGDVQTRGNSELRFLRILINGVDKRTAISKAIVDQIHSVFKPDQIFETTIPVNTTFERAEAKGQTVFQCDGTSAGARAFRNLGKELLTILGG